MIVLVTDASFRNALAAVRSLGRAGHQVWTVGDRRRDPGSWSRYSRRRVLAPAPAEEPERFAAFMLEFVARNPCDVLLPVSDYATYFAAAHRAELGAHVCVAVPELESLRLARDKAALPALAAQAGLLVPRTFCPASDAELREVARAIDYPCIVKPRSGGGAVGVRYASTPEELLACFPAAALPPDVFCASSDPVVQEVVPGETHDVCLLFDSGEPVAALTQKRIKMRPSEGGQGIVNETTDEPELREQAIRLLRSLHWHGPAQVEFKLEPGRAPVLIEINGRFWGTLDLAVQAGIDFPGLTARVALGQKLEPRFEHEVGLRYRWIVPYELAHFLRSEAKWRELPGLFRLGSRTRCDVSPTDPLPFLAHLAGIVQRALPGKRGRNRLRRH